MGSDSTNGPRLELWKQVVATLGAVLVAGIGAWQAIKLATPNSKANDDPQISTTAVAAPEFVADFVFESSSIELAEFEIDPSYRLPGSNEEFAQLSRVEYGSLADGSRAFSVRLILRNVSDRPIQLDLTERFFALKDDQGREAELLYFCCRASGELLSVKQERAVQLIFRAVPGWQGKQLQANAIYFQVIGLLPIVRALWWFRPLATAA